MSIKDDLVQQLMEIESEILEAKKLQTGKTQNAWVGSRYQDGTSTKLSEIYSEQSSSVITRLQQQRDQLAAQLSVCRMTMNKFRRGMKIRR